MTIQETGVGFIPYHHNHGHPPIITRENDGERFTWGIRVWLNQSYVLKARCPNHGDAQELVDLMNYADRQWQEQQTARATERAEQSAS